MPGIIDDEHNAVKLLIPGVHRYGESVLEENLIDDEDIVNKVLTSPNYLYQMGISKIILSCSVRKIEQYNYTTNNIKDIRYIITNGISLIRKAEG